MTNAAASTPLEAIEMAIRILERAKPTVRELNTVLALLEAGRDMLRRGAR